MGQGTDLKAHFLISRLTERKWPPGGSDSPGMGDPALAALAFGAQPGQALEMSLTTAADATAQDA